MRILIVLLLLLIGAATYLLWKSRRDPGVQRKTIAVADIADVFRQISSQAIETSFAVFIIQRGEGADPVEIQFSVEDGKTGLDWILMSPPNIEEKPKVIEYAASRGFEWQEQEMNDWQYMRIGDGDIAGLCTSLIADLYEAGQVELKYGGFRYSPLST